MTSTRLTSAERKAFLGKRAGEIIGRYECEPALGTLDERLGILVRRHGGRTRVQRLSSHERADYLAWLRENDPTATNPWTGRPVQEDS